MKHGLLCALALLAGSPAAQDDAGQDDSGARAELARAEAEYYAVEHLPLPEGVVMEVGGLGFLSGGSLVASTRRGQVWIVENALADDPESAVFRLFADGLHEGLGLAVVDDVIHVVQRTELSRLHDDDGDGRCDRIETVSDDWGCTGNYHEFAYGLPVDPDGAFWVSLNLGFFSPYWWIGQSLAPWRGWVLRIEPDGTTTPWALGFRSPDGLGLNHEGDLFATDNQGDWMPVCPLFHVVKGGFYGHFASLRWTSLFAADRGPDWFQPPAVRRRPAAVWLPYDLSRSAGNLVADETGGAFGPFSEQLFVAELTNGRVVRCQLEKVRGEYQGSVFAFREGVGSAHRVRFAPDGSLFVGLTNRGWGGEDPSHGIARVRWTGRAPMEMAAVELLQDGFEITFTAPLGEAPSREQIEVVQYDYDWWWKYGSPERNHRSLEVLAVEVGADRRRARLRLADLRPGWMTRIELDGVRAADGTPLLHGRVDYTLNQLPRGPLTTKRIARRVEPPLTEEQEAEGWLQLTDGRTMDAWQGAEWRIVGDVALADDPSALQAEDGKAALLAAPATEIVSRPRFQDCTVRLGIMLPREGAATLGLGGAHEVALQPGRGREAVTVRTAARPQPADAVPVALEPGGWAELELRYRAPRWGAGGLEVPARLSALSLDGVTLYRDLPLAAPAGVAEPDWAPLVLRAGTAAAFRDVRVRPERARDDGEGWVALFGGDSVADATPLGETRWTVRDGLLTGAVAPGALLWPEELGDFEVSVRAKVARGTDAGIVVRAAAADSGAEGYRVQINRSHAAASAKTGSVLGLEEIRTWLIPRDDVWFDQRVRVVDEAAGTRVRVWLNGALVVDAVDAERRWPRGRVGVTLDHAGGGFVHFESVRVRPAGTGF